MGLRDLLCSIWCGCNDNWDLTKLEEHERSVAKRQVTQGMVWEGATEMVKTTNDWELPWAWREAKAMAMTRSEGSFEGLKENI